MSTRSRPTETIIQAANDGDLVPLGTYEARDDKTGLTLRMPKTAERSNGAVIGDEYDSWLDQETGAIVYLPSE